MGSSQGKDRGRGLSAPSPRIWPSFVLIGQGGTGLRIQARRTCSQGPCWWGKGSMGDRQAPWGKAWDLAFLPISPCLPGRAPAPPWASTVTQCLPSSPSVSLHLSNLSPCVSVPHCTPNSPSQKGNQGREEPGVPGVHIPSCLRSLMDPQRPLEDLILMARTCSCSPVIPTADPCTPQRMEMQVWGLPWSFPGFRGQGK